jgi:uncharacterized protein YktA (UPF0223 family)
MIIKRVKYMCENFNQFKNLMPKKQQQKQERACFKTINKLSNKEIVFPLGW